MKHLIFLPLFLVLNLNVMTFQVACAASSLSSALAGKTLKAQLLLDQHYGNRARLLQAQQYIGEVLNTDPNFVPAYIQAARLIIKGGHIVSNKFVDGTLASAEEILLRAKGLEPDNGEVFSLLGHVYTRKGDFKAAIASLDRAKELKVTNPWLNNNYGDVYNRQRLFENADDYYAIVHKLGPGNTPQQRGAFVYALDKRLWIAALKEDNAEVIRLGKLITAAAPPEDAWAWGGVANVLFIQGYLDESIAHSRKALSIMKYGVGENTLALGLYGKWASLAASGRGPEAEKYFDEAYALRPDLANVVNRFRQSAKVVVDLAPIVQKRMIEIRK